MRPPADWPGMTLLLSSPAKRIVTVVPAQAGTHNHRLWNMGPRFRGDDSFMS
jgi:hypothetical protein